MSPRWPNSVLPIVAANRVDIVKSAHAFDELVTLIPTPGHTIDHYSVRVGRPGADAVITGDMIHSPLQARYPELGMMSVYNSKQAAQTRRELFSCFCATLKCTAHFPSLSTAGSCAGAKRSTSSRRERAIPSPTAARSTMLLWATSQDPDTGTCPVARKRRLERERTKVPHRCERREWTARDTNF